MPNPCLIRLEPFSLNSSSGCGSQRPWVRDEFRQRPCILVSSWADLSHQPHRCEWVRHIRCPWTPIFPSLMNRVDRLPGCCRAQAGVSRVPFLAWGYFPAARAQCCLLVPSDPSAALAWHPHTPSQPSPHCGLQLRESGLRGTPGDADIPNSKWLSTTL